jgi:dehydrogenase/reductase SDR family member 7
MGNHPSLYNIFYSYQFVPGCSVVITGASSGMGKEMTYRYAQRGCRIVIGARRLDELEKIKEECFHKFGNANIKCMSIDVSIEEESKVFIESAAEFLDGRIDIMALCAGISAHSLFEDFEDFAPFR